jgi:hypothetical protein
VRGTIKAESCQHFVTIFGDHDPMIRDENLDAVIQGLRSRSVLSAEYMQAAKIEWPRPKWVLKWVLRMVSLPPSLSSL